MLEVLISKKNVARKFQSSGFWASSCVASFHICGLYQDCGLNFCPNYCSDFRNESNGNSVLAVVFLFRQVSII